MTREGKERRGDLVTRSSQMPLVAHEASGFAYARHVRPRSFIRSQRQRLYTSAASRCACKERGPDGLVLSEVPYGVRRVSIHVSVLPCTAEKVEVREPDLVECEDGRILVLIAYGELWLRRFDQLIFTVFDVVRLLARLVSELAYLTLPLFLPILLAIFFRFFCHLGLVKFLSHPRDLA